MGECFKLKRKSVAERLRAARAALERVTARVDDEVEKIARVAKILADLSREDAQIGDQGPAAKGRESAQESVLREEARVGCTLALAWKADGAADVRVNGGRTFRLPPKPAALLGVISEPGSRLASDGSAGWHSYAEVAAALGKITGRATSTRNVIQSIHKLRRAFRDAGQNWFLIHTDRRGAVRFALRPQAPPSIAGSEVTAR